MESIIDQLTGLFKQWSGINPESIKTLPASGSDRVYYRLSARDKSAIGAWNPVPEENEAFLHFTEVFFNAGLHVPEVYAADIARNIYLVEDLGDVTLFSLMENRIYSDVYPGDIVSLYRDSLSELVRFQLSGGEKINFGKCYPYPVFDKQAILWDLNYFKYYFLRLHAPFHEARLENDFNVLADYLAADDNCYFMYRDFQSRNIMIHEGKPFFIDYQGGRKGPLQYDVASLLFQVRADLPFAFREEMLGHYISELSKHISIDTEAFRERYYGFVLIRLLQVLGAYGYRGLIEKKPHFITSIPFALKSLKWWLENVKLPMELPELNQGLAGLAGLTNYDEPASGAEEGKLKVTLRSFSYRQGYPPETGENGGGFVFDCRALPNPGREEKLRAFNGKDRVIIEYLEHEPAVIRFLEEAEKLVSISVDNYLERNFSRLSVNFGCTGGQHRSVYCTEVLAERLRKKYPGILIKIDHLKLNQA